MFETLFERSADAIWLYDPRTALLIDCNQAAVDLIGAATKNQLLSTRPEDLSPPLQPDGSHSSEKSAAIIALVETKKRHLFEWVIRRLDGRDVPVEVSSTALVMDGQSVHVIVSRDISERKKAERDLLEMTHALERRVAERTAELETSEARFRALVEHAAEAIVVYNVDTGRFLFGNQHACALYGITMSELAKLTPADVSPEFQPCGGRSSDLIREKTNEVLTGGISTFDWVHQQPDGRQIPTEVRLLRLPAEGQTLIRASIIDNTARKFAERALRESEAKFRALFEGASQGVVLHDDTRILEVNPAAVRILGRARAEDMLGRHPSETAPVLQPNGQKSDLLARKHIEECLTTGSARFEWLSCDPQGKEIPLEVYLTRIDWNGRQVIQAFITDISERLHSQAALAESEARFSLAFQASPILIAIASLSDGKFVLANDAFVNWAGYTREEILGRNTTELKVWDSPDDREVFWADLREAGSIRERECRFRNRHARLFTMLISAEVIHLNHVPHVLAMALDITERKQAEAELLKTLAREKELGQLKSNFVSMVSHEFRTPLSIIQSSAELLRDFLPRMPASERLEHLESISRNCRRMAGMMEEILVLSRLDAGKLQFQPSAFDVAAFYRQVVDGACSATNRRCPVELSLADLPQQAIGDERLLDPIFNNLLSNAIKYSNDGSVVRFHIGQEGHDAVCVIRDHGIGIPEEDRKQLFTAFQRGTNVGNRPGTGLGLLLVKRCVELHSGRVQLESLVGKGTTVTVRLPLFATLS